MGAVVVQNKLERATFRREIWIWVPNNITLLDEMRAWCYNTLGHRSVGEHPWDISDYDTKCVIFEFTSKEGALMFKLAWSAHILDELEMGLF